METERQRETETELETETERLCEKRREWANGCARWSCHPLVPKGLPSLQSLRGKG